MTTTINNQKSINCSDTLFARVTLMDRQLFNVQLCEMASLSQVVNWVRGELSGMTGLVKISLRNVSQGWTTDHWCNLATRA